MVRAAVPALALLALGCPSPREPGATTVAVAAPPPATASLSAAPRDTHPPDPDPRDVLQAFQASFNTDVLPNAKPTDQAFLSGIEAELAAGSNSYTVTLLRCSDAARRIRKTVTELNHDFVLFGSAAAAERSAPCWSVFYRGGMKKEVEGILSHPDLRTLVVWRVPEG